MLIGGEFLEFRIRERHQEPGGDQQCEDTFDDIVERGIVGRTGESAFNVPVKIGVVVGSVDVKLPGSGREQDDGSEQCDEPDLAACPVADAGG